MKKHTLYFLLLLGDWVLVYWNESSSTEENSLISCTAWMEMKMGALENCVAQRRLCVNCEHLTSLFQEV